MNVCTNKYCRNGTSISCRIPLQTRNTAWRTNHFGSETCSDIPRNSGGRQTSPTPRMMNRGENEQVEVHKECAFWLRDADQTACPEVSRDSDKSQSGKARRCAWIWTDQFPNANTTPIWHNSRLFESTVWFLSFCGSNERRKTCDFGVIMLEIRGRLSERVAKKHSKKLNLDLCWLQFVVGIWNRHCWRAEKFFVAERCVIVYFLSCICLGDWIREYWKFWVSLKSCVITYWQSRFYLCFIFWDKWNFA